MARLRGMTVRRVGRDERLSVVEHLDELRNRIIVSIVALVVAFAVAYGFNEQLLRPSMWPLPERYKEHRADHPLADRAVLHGAEGLLLRGAAGRAADLALPALRLRDPGGPGPAPPAQDAGVVAGASSLFLAGVAFGYFVVLPVALNFLLGFGGDTFLTQVRAGEYFGFVTTLLLASGLHVRGAGRDARAGAHRGDQRRLLHPPLARGDRRDRGRWRRSCRAATPSACCS